MSEEIIAVWKCTRANGLPIYGSKALPQPRGKKPGAWHDVGCYPVPCAVGVHGCRTLVDMLRDRWLNEELYVAELRGPIVDVKDKAVGRSGRLCYRVEAWNKQTARLFTADCAEMVAHLHPIVAPTAHIVRRYAFGLASSFDLAAAEAAAWAAERAAAEAAAWAAERGAAEAAAEAAAGDAAEAAARGAAVAAAGAAALDAEQTTAGAAALIAAGAAARIAAYRRMALRLHNYLTGKVDIEAIRRSVE